MWSVRGIVGYNIYARKINAIFFAYKTYIVLFTV
jgi:hypothetical protein